MGKELRMDDWRAHEEYFRTQAELCMKLAELSADLKRGDILRSEAARYHAMAIEIAISHPPERVRLRKN
jgi:hypothetical protein